MGQQRMLKKNNKKIKSVFISEKNHSHQTGEGNKFEQEIMWDNWSLPQGPPCWVLLKGSPHSLVRRKLKEVLHSLQIRHCPSADGQLSHSGFPLQRPAGCVTWLFLFSWGGTQPVLTAPALRASRNEQPEATAVTALTPAGQEHHTCLRQVFFKHQI